MEIHNFTLGPIETNCYVVCSETACFIVDPSSDNEQAIELIKEAINGRELKFILYTHNHFDHIAGGHCFDVDGFMHKNDRATIQLQKAGALMFTKKNIIIPKTKELGATVDFEGTQIKVFFTPGHSSGSVSFFIDEHKGVNDKPILFSGDTLFKGAYGRTDLPGSSMKQMINSLHELAKLPDETLVLPGHGLQTTISAEKIWMKKLEEFK